MIEKMFLLLATNTTTPNTPSDGMSLNTGRMSILRGFRKVDIDDIYVLIFCFAKYCFIFMQYLCKLQRKEFLSQL